MKIFKSVFLLFLMAVVSGSCFGASGNNQSSNGKPQVIVKKEGGSLWNCDKLESVVLPSTTEKLDQNMFAGCPLKMLVCKAQVPPVADFYTFSVRAGFDFPVYVPVGSAELYSKAEVWNRFTNFIETNDFPTAGSEAAFAAGGTKVTGAAGMAVIETAGATAYEIYATDGRMAAAGGVCGCRGWPKS